MKYLCLVYQEEKQEANVPHDVIEQTFGKDVTTRTWDTVVKVAR